MIALDDDLQQLYDNMRAYARAYRPPKRPADFVRPVYVENGFSHWEVRDGECWQRASVPEVRRLLRATFCLRVAAIDCALGGLLGPIVKPKLDYYCQTLLDALLSDFHEKLVADWLAVTPLSPNLSAEGLRHAFEQAHPGIRVGSSLFRHIYEV